jgi:hypothetical protein
MINTSKYLLLFVLIFTTFPLLLSSTPQSEKCLAVITEINGKALYKPAGTDQFSKASWGVQLFNGDQVATDANSEVRILYEGNRLITMHPNSILTVSGPESYSTRPMGEVKTISSAIGVNLSSLTFKRNEKDDMGALAGVRSVVVDNPIVPELPFNTKIKTNRPDFSWFSKGSYDSYTLFLYSSKGLVWSKTVKDTSLKYPDDEKGLDYGESYFWNVEGEDLVNADKSSNRKFTILSAVKSREVADHETQIRNSFIDSPESSSFHSVMGAYYIGQGLLQDAIEEFLIIAGLNKEAPMPHEILGSLYSEIGEKDKAIEELKLALALTNKKDK